VVVVADVLVSVGFAAVGGVALVPAGVSLAEAFPPLVVSAVVELPVSSGLAAGAELGGDVADGASSSMSDGPLAPLVVWTVQPDTSIEMARIVHRRSMSSPSCDRCLRRRAEGE
jgi:hypothetical protein